MTSFPFLKIARDFGVPYGDVIRCAHAWGVGRRMNDAERTSFHALCKVSDALIVAIQDAADIENRRRSQP